MSPTRSADAVSVVDLAEQRVVETVKVGEKPAGIAVAPGGARIYVSNPAAHSVSVVERIADGTHKTIAEIAAGQGPLGLALDVRESACSPPTGIPTGLS